MECEHVERGRDQSFTEPTGVEHTSRMMNSGDPYHRDFSNDRHRNHKHRDQIQRFSPEQVQEMEQSSRRTRLDDTRRMDLHRSNGQYSVTNALSSPQLERHPERLMQSHGQSIVKDSDKFGKYQRKSVGISNRSERHASPEGDFYADQLNQQRLDPNSAAAAARYAARGVHRRGENMVRNDSLGSDLSDCARPPALKPRKSRKGSKHSSMSSSDDEMPTTPDGTSWEDQEYINDKGSVTVDDSNYSI